MKIFIIHPGKATYPEINAYRNYFGNEYIVLDGCIEDYQNHQDKINTIAWCIMGLYPKKIEAKYVIHDYRSLSVGKLAKIKDIIKRYLNSKPDLRIFQNVSIQKIMGFKDNLPELILPMGIPSWIFEVGPDENLPSGKYCYIGEISKERDMDKVIDCFLINRKPTDKFILVGPVQESIINQYVNNDSLVFFGKTTQETALKIVSNCKYAICKIPEKYPFSHQMPTKFIEYAALNKNIICNKSPSNLKAHNEINSKVLFTSENIFDGGLDHEKKLSINISAKKPKDIIWETIIKNSGIPQYLKI